MARVTVEDCVEIVSNRFELVLLAARRAREISAGATLTVDRDKDKNPVVGLREIAERTIDLSLLQDNLIKSMQRHAFRDEVEEDLDSELEEALQTDLGAGNGALEDLSDKDDDEEEGDMVSAQMEEAEAATHLDVQSDS